MDDAGLGHEGHKGRGHGGIDGVAPRAQYLGSGGGRCPVAGGLALASSVAWLCDDAFISFRYADHLARGLGLVFNVGERVEGYTSFLWVVTSAGALLVGVSPLAAARTKNEETSGLSMWSKARSNSRPNARSS